MLSPYPIDPALTAIAVAYKNDDYIADVVLPGTILAEKEGTFTNLQGTAQQIHQAYPPKGQAVTDLELYERLATRLLREKVDAA